MKSARDCATCDSATRRLATYDNEMVNLLYDFLGPALLCVHSNARISWQSDFLPAFLLFFFLRGSLPLRSLSSYDELSCGRGGSSWIYNDMNIKLTALLRYNRIRPNDFVSDLGLFLHISSSEPWSNSSSCWRAASAWTGTASPSCCHASTPSAWSPAWRAWWTMCDDRWVRERESC